MNAKKPEPDNVDVDAKEKTEPKVCGIIMPIAAMGDYEESHWGRVRRVIDEAITEAGMIPRMVSESEEITVIQSRIVQNLYENEIVVCDVSGKNPNVMFELGMRLAFDKPTVVVKDDATSYSFDTSPIKHIGYRRDLRYDDVRAFKQQVTEAILASVKAGKDKQDYSPFLKHFGKITFAKIETTEVSSTEFLAKQLGAIQSELSHLNTRISMTQNDLPGVSPLMNSGLLSMRVNKYDAEGRPAIKELAGTIADTVASDYDVVTDTLVNRTAKRN